MTLSNRPTDYAGRKGQAPFGHSLDHLISTHFSNRVIKYGDGLCLVFWLAVLIRQVTGTYYWTEDTDLVWLNDWAFEGVVATLRSNFLLSHLAVTIFSHLLPKLCTYFNVCLIDSATRIFSTSYAATRNWTKVRSVAPILRDLNPGRFTDWAATAMASDCHIKQTRKRKRLKRPGPQT